jgi:hypothetical protein
MEEEAGGSPLAAPRFSAAAALAAAPRGELRIAMPPTPPPGGPEGAGAAPPSPTAADLLALWLDTPTVVADERRLRRMLAGMGVALPEAGGRTAGEALNSLLASGGYSASGAGSGASPYGGLEARGGGAQGTPSSSPAGASPATVPEVTPLPPPPLGLFGAPQQPPLPPPPLGDASPAGSAGTPLSASPPPQKCLGCALDDLMAVDSMLTGAVGFWAHMEIVIDLIVRRKEHSETLLAATVSSQAMVTKTQASLSDYDTFWNVFVFLCDSYGKALLEQTEPMFAWLSSPASTHHAAAGGLFALTNH